MSFFRHIITLAGILCALPLSAQRVGLVLSGGGARGLYHIGVIRALEENGIPIDYVSGTSMGAIIGGLYAAGYSPEEMSRIFTSPQIGLWMSGRIEDRYVYYFKQPEPNASMLNLLFDPDSPKVAGQPRLQLPTNLISSRQIDMAFVEFFAGPEAACRGNFDSLMIPFRCVATDATARREVVYRDGNLGRSIRASMTIPLVFRPLKQDSTLLYDGGIYNNFPWQVLQEDFSPEILIGSKCVAGNSRSSEENVVDQISTLTMMHTDYSLPREEDVLIEHTFDDVTMLDFSKAQYVIDRGYSDAIDAMPMIRERIARRVDTVALSARRRVFREREPDVHFHQYEIAGLSQHQTEYVERLLRQKSASGGDGSFSLADFRTEYFKMLSTGDIESDFPDVRYDTLAECFDLRLNLRIKPSFKVMLGGNISSTSMNQAYVGLQYRRIGRSAQTYRLDGYASALYSSIQAGQRIDFFLGKPLALDYSLNYNYYNFFRSNFGGLGGGTDLFYNKSGDAYFTTALSFPSSRATRFALRANLGRENYRYYDTPDYTDQDRMDHSWFVFTGLQAELDRNGQNYLMYPTRGLRQSLSGIFVHGKEHYAPGTTAASPDPEEHRRTWFGARFLRENYFPIAGWFSAGYLVEAVATNHPSFSNSNATNLTSPAFLPTAHSHLVYLEDFRSRAFLGIGLMPTFEFGSKFYLKNSVYAFMPENLSDTRGSDRKRVRYIFSSSLVYQTFIGPASLTLTKYDATSNDNWFLTFNFGFTLFNRKGLFY